jgi:hypothetical protein
VIACIREADSILIFGPGEAKGEPMERLKRNKLGGRIAAIETVDKMTDRQIAAKVRAYFDQKTARNGVGSGPLPETNELKHNRAVSGRSVSRKGSSRHDKD